MSPSTILQRLEIPDCRVALPHSNRPNQWLKTSRAGTRPLTGCRIWHYICRLRRTGVAENRAGIFQAHPDRGGFAEAEKHHRGLVVLDGDAHSAGKPTTPEAMGTRSAADTRDEPKRSPKSSTSFQRYRQRGREGPSFPRTRHPRYGHPSIERRRRGR